MNFHPTPCCLQSTHRQKGMGQKPETGWSIRADSARDWLSLRPGGSQHMSGPPQLGDKAIGGWGFARKWWRYRLQAPSSRGVGTGGAKGLLTKDPEPSFQTGCPGGPHHGVLSSSEAKLLMSKSFKRESFVSFVNLEQMLI